LLLLLLLSIQRFQRQPARKTSSSMGHFHFDSIPSLTTIPNDDNDNDNDAHHHVAVMLMIVMLMLMMTAAVLGSPFYTRYALSKRV